MYDILLLLLLVPLLSLSKGGYDAVTLLYVRYHVCLLLYVRYIAAAATTAAAAVDDMGVFTSTDVSLAPSPELICTMFVRFIHPYPETKRLMILFETLTICYTTPHPTTDKKQESGVGGLVMSIRSQY